MLVAQPLNLQKAQELLLEQNWEFLDTLILTGPRKKNMCCAHVFSGTPILKMSMGTKMHDNAYKKNYLYGT